MREHGARQAETAKASPFDFTQGHESFDYAQDPEALEGQRRMARLVLPFRLPVSSLSRRLSLCSLWLLRP